MPEFIVEMHDIVKTFGDIQAVTSGQFNLKKGEIHSLIGENGAGKSTMMKMLYGMYPPDSGQISINGAPIHTLSPKKALEMGIGMVHQEFMLINELTVLENIILGFEPKKNVMIDFAKASKDIQHYIDTYHMDIQPNKRINQISVGEAQRVEIIKTLYRGANILILDEPTAVLTPQETDKFFEILLSLKAQGASIVFISHKLDEVMAISDRISVMRQSNYVATVDKDKTDKTELAKMMVGREVFLNDAKQQSSIGGSVLSLKDVWTSGEKELSKIKGVSFDVHAGEIVGIAGIDGNGQSELIEAIAGLRKVEKGSVMLAGANITNRSPKAIRSAGLTHIPEDRNIRGLNRAMTLNENLVAVKFQEAPFSKKGVLNQKAIGEYGKKLIERFDVRPSDPQAFASSLSGGNAQKIVVAREVEADGKLLIASQPSRGVDIGAIESIRRVLNEEKAKGKGILLVSADLEEIFSLSDRIIVLYEGKITAEVHSQEVSPNQVGLYMMGRNEESRGVS